MQSLPQRIRRSQSDPRSVVTQRLSQRRDRLIPQFSKSHSSHFANGRIFVMQRTDQFLKDDLFRFSDLRECTCRIHLHFVRVLKRDRKKVRHNAWPS